MKVELNGSTTIEIGSNIITVRSDEAKGKISKTTLYLNKSKVFGCELTYIKFFSLSAFLTVFFVGLVGAFGYYYYQSNVANSSPQLVIVGGIAIAGLLFGLMRAFKRKRHLVLIVENDGLNVLNKSRFSFPVSHDLKDKKIEEMMAQIVQ
jgi:hypothetical protein